MIVLYIGFDNYRLNKRWFNHNKLFFFRNFRFVFLFQHQTWWSILIVFHVCWYCHICTNLMTCTIPQQDQCNMCIYSQNTTIFISSILAIYCIRHNYMFRLLMLAIFRLYMNLSSNYTTYVGCFLGSGERVFFVWDRGLFCVSGGCMVWKTIISYSCFLTIYRH